MLQLRLSNFNVAYHGIPAIIDLSVTLTAATVNLLTGMIGAGKTSLIRALSGAIGHSGWMELSEGLQTFDRKSILQPLPRSFVSRDMSVMQFVQFGMMQNAWKLPHDAKERIHEALERSELISFAQSPISSLSPSQIRMLELAQLFVQQPRVILLDEPSTQLSSQTENSVLTCISKWVSDTQNIALVASDSSRAFGHVDRVLTLERGRLLSA